MGGPGTDAACVPSRPQAIVEGPMPGPNLALEVPAPGADTDGDGALDDLDAEPAAIGVHRGSGTVTLRPSPRATLAVLTWGDLDADGRDDLLVREEGAAGPRVIVVPGSTADGDTTAVAAGVRIDGSLTQIWPDDLDGAPGDDLVVLERGAERSRTDVWSGAAILQEGPGGDARGLPPARRLRGLPRVLAPLAPGAVPETLLYEPGETASVRFASRPRAVLRTSGPASRVEEVVVFDQDGVRKIGLRIDRRLAVWEVPPPCR